MPEQLEAEVYTYVGSGPDVPQITTFIGQTFRRGEETEVTDPAVLAKIVGHPCFVKGKTKAEEIVKKDEEERQGQQKRKKRLEQIEAKARQRNEKYKGGEE